MEPNSYIDAIETNASAVAVAGRADVSANVPSCPGWAVADVLRHLGGVHRWAASAVRTGQRPESLPSAPEGGDGEALVEWYEQGAGELTATLRAADPDADVWTFALPHSVRFWLRRQAHETAVHAWDVQAAVGRSLSLDAELAADGVDEFLTVMLPRWLGREPGTWAGESIHVHRTDGDGEWLLTLGPAGSVTTERTHQKADAAIRGTAMELLLWVNNRRSAEGLELFGNEELVSSRWVAEVRF